VQSPLQDAPREWVDQVNTRRFTLTWHCRGLDCRDLGVSCRSAISRRGLANADSVSCLPVRPRFPLICLKVFAHLRDHAALIAYDQAGPMPNTGIKALLTILALNRSSRPLDWDRVIIAGSTLAEAGLSHSTLTQRSPRSGRSRPQPARRGRRNRHMSVRVAQLLVLIGARAQAAAGGTLRGRILLKPMGARKSQFEF
jgi:hypothetical protein